MFVLGNREDAQDAAQEAFLKCWRTRSGLSAVQTRAWVFRVGLNVAKDVQRRPWRRRGRFWRTARCSSIARTDPGRAAEDREDVGRFRTAIAGLRREEQEVFLLRQNGGLTYEQIAEVRTPRSAPSKPRWRRAAKTPQGPHVSQLLAAIHRRVGAV